MKKQPAIESCTQCRFFREVITINNRYLIGSVMRSYEEGDVARLCDAFEWPIIKKLPGDSGKYFPDWCPLDDIQ